MIWKFGATVTFRGQIRIALGFLDKAPAYVISSHDMASVLSDNIALIFYQLKGAADMILPDGGPSDGRCAGGKVMSPG
jgi:hypothetical protein